MTKSAHVDTFARDNLPPRSQWPELLFELPEMRYPERMNCATELLDRMIAAQALVHRAKLVTFNAGDFSDIPNLPLLTW